MRYTGTCLACGEEHPIRNDDTTVIIHNVPGIGECPGSRRAPLEETPRYKLKEYVEALIYAEQVNPRVDTDALDRISSLIDRLEPPCPVSV